MSKKRKETFAEKARRARMIRPIEGDYKGKNSTHLMSTVEQDGIHYAYPTITNKTESGEFVDQSFENAKKSGELFEFKTHKEADAFAKGSWKLKLISDLHKDIEQENFLEKPIAKPFEE